MFYQLPADVKTRTTSAISHHQDVKTPPLAGGRESSALLDTGTGSGRIGTRSGMPIRSPAFPIPAINHSG